MTPDKELRRLAEDVRQARARYNEQRIGNGTLHELLRCASEVFSRAATEETILALLDRLEAAEKERDQHKEMHEYFQKDAQELAAQLEGPEVQTYEGKRYWYDRAWAAFKAMPDDFRGSLSVHQVRELFRIMYSTRPANKPDEFDEAGRNNKLADAIDAIYNPVEPS